MGYLEEVGRRLMGTVIVMIAYLMSGVCYGVVICVWFGSVEIKGSNINQSPHTAFYRVER